MGGRLREKLPENDAFVFQIFQKTMTCRHAPISLACVPAARRPSRPHISSSQEAAAAAEAAGRAVTVASGAEDANAKQQRSHS
eukprot:1446956-Pleurochrysis_carterae.AAC.1